VTGKVVTAVETVQGQDQVALVDALDTRAKVCQLNSLAHVCVVCAVAAAAAGVVAAAAVGVGVRRVRFCSEASAAET
jgi:hypothetical protein